MAYAGTMPIPLLFFALVPAQSTGVSLAPHVDWPLTGSQPQEVAVVDFDRDGDLDLVVSSSGDPDQTLKWNDGTGVFDDEESIITAFPSWGVGVGDFDGNGWPDLAFGDGWYGGSDVEVWFGNPADPARPVLGAVLAAGSFPIALRGGDVDGDGDDDLVVANDVSGGVMLFRNLGGGVFGTAEQLPSTASMACRKLELADVDGDGDLDVVLTAYGLWVFPNDGTGHFPVRNHVGASGHVGLAVADFDQDGILDFATSALYSNVVDVIRGDGAGGGRLIGSVAFSADVTGLHAADLNGDGLADLVGVLSWPGQVAVVTGHGDGTFHTAQTFATDVAPQVVASGDFDSDGDPDLVTANRVHGADATVSVLDDVSPPEAWRHLGLGLEGPSGDLPLLRGSGATQPGGSVRLDLEHGAAGGNAVLVVGRARRDLPFSGGVLVPRPDFVLPPLPLDAQGAGAWNLTVPPTTPVGSSAWFQAWMDTRDAASNGLRLTIG